MRKRRPGDTRISAFTSVGGPSRRIIRPNGLTDYYRFADLSASSRRWHPRRADRRLIKRSRRGEGSFVIFYTDQDGSRDRSELHVGGIKKKNPLELSTLNLNRLPVFCLQTAKNSTSGSGYYVGGSSTLPRGGPLLRAYSPAASSVVGGPNSTPTQPKTLTTPGIRMPEFILLPLPSRPTTWCVSSRARVHAHTHMRIEVQVCKSTRDRPTSARPGSRLPGPSNERSNDVPEDPSLQPTTSLDSPNPRVAALRAEVQNLSAGKGESGCLVARCSE